MLAGTGVGILRKQVGIGFRSIFYVTESSAAQTSSTEYVTVPGATQELTFAANEAVVVGARFAGESRCTGQSPSSYCTVRLVAIRTADGAVFPLNPNSGFDFAFDSVGISDDYWESNAMERWIVLGGGVKFRIEAQYAVTSAANTFRLDDWTRAVSIHNTPAEP